MFVEFLTSKTTLKTMYFVRAVAQQYYTHSILIAFPTNLLNICEFAVKSMLIKI